MNTAIDETPASGPAAAAPTVEPAADPAGVDLNVNDDALEVDPEDPSLTPAALRQLRTAARHACRTAARNSHYPADLAVAVLADATAALAHLAREIGPYTGDLWKPAGDRVESAAVALFEAQRHLDAAWRHTDLMPANDGTGTGD